MENNKKVAIFCPYSYPSACGIWTRAFSDAKALKEKGYDVSIFSSNIIKGTNQTSSAFEEYEGIKLYRFKVLFSLGGTSMFWYFYNKLHEVNPDIIHSHGYRHPHSLFSLLWGKFHNKVNFLTTHAPFEKDSNRSIIMKMVDVLYDYLIGWWELRLYKKVIRISNWEVPYLEKLGITDAEFIPNGLKHLFFEKVPQINKKEFKRVIYMGRIDPVKRPEWLLKAAEKLKEYNFEIIGPLSGYDKFESTQDNLKVVLKTYNSEEFIEEVDKSDIYVLGSSREAMPFTLLEAMSRGKFVISSNTNGGKEVIENNTTTGAQDQNGFIVKNEDELIDKIKYVYDNWANLDFIRYNAVSTAKTYSSEESNRKLLWLYQF